MVAAVALYALLLQAFLVTLAPTGTFDPLSTGVICAHDANGAPTNDLPLRHAHDCCTAACLSVATPAPDPDASAIVWPERISAVIAWFDGASPAKTGPPSYASSARGPPSA